MPETRSHLEELARYISERGARRPQGVSVDLGRGVMGSLHAGSSPVRAANMEANSGNRALHDVIMKGVQSAIQGRLASRQQQAEQAALSRRQMDEAQQIDGRRQGLVAPMPRYGFDTMTPLHAARELYPPMLPSAPAGGIPMPQQAPAPAPQPMPQAAPQAPQVPVQFQGNPYMMPPSR